MLLNFSVENFKSFYDEQKITFEQDYNSAEIFKNNTIFEYKENKKKKSVLNGVLILGANAAGKTNIINALNIVKNFLSDSISFNNKDDIYFNLSEFKLNKQNKKYTKFNIEFMNEIKGDFYKLKYCFSINPKNMLIENESLKYQKVLKTTLSNEILIFERNKDSINCNSKEINNVFNKVKQENINHKLILSLLNFDINKSYFVNEVTTLSYQIIESCAISIGKDLIFSNDSSHLEEFIEEINNNSDFKDYILDSLYKYDFALTDFNIQDITDHFVESIKRSSFFNDMEEQEAIKFLARLSKQKKYKVETIHNVEDTKYELPLAAESAGTKKFLIHALGIYESILMGRTYISDEFDSHYHYFIQKGILNSFVYPEVKNKTQFLIVTHNPLLIDNQIFSKEQIHFVEKDRFTQQSSIFTLKDFNNITYNNHNWVNLYLEGRMGAVPEVFD